MKNKCNNFLNHIFKTPAPLELTGLFGIAVLQITAAATGIAKIEICRQLVDFLFRKDFVHLMATSGLFICVHMILSVLGRAVERRTAAMRGHILMSLMDMVLGKNENLLFIGSHEMSANDKMSIADGDCERYVDSIMGRVELFSRLVTTPCYMIYGFTINVWITILILTISIILSMLNKKNKLRLYQCNEEYNERYGVWSNFLWKALDNLEVMRVFLSRDKVICEQRKRNDSLCETQKNSLKAYLDVCLIEESSDMLFTLMILCLSFVAVMRNSMSMASIFAMIEAMNSVQKNIFQLPEQFIRLHELESIASRIYQLERMEEDSAQEALDEDLQTLTVQNVSFGYQQNDILKGVSYMFEKGRFYILAGASGCGKSTLLKVIVRLFPVREGNIYWNQLDLSRLKRDSIYKKVSYISQNQMFLADTIKANICLDQSDEDTYCRVLGESYVQDIFGKNQYGDDQMLNINGWPLSSGERQMVSFASILYLSRQLILLDEAFSAVDPAKEQHFFKCLKFLTQRGATVILVSHRLTNFDMADQILYMADGQIRESGSFETLCEKDTLFRTWYRTNGERNAE